MASLKLDYTPGSGFVPLISGNPWSGHLEPIGILQLRADKNNSGYVYISLSGAFIFSGQIGAPPASGGPTITSGTFFLSGGISSGVCDGFPMGPGDAYAIPRISFISGVYGICAGCDPTCSGQARLYMEAF